MVKLSELSIYQGKKTTVSPTV